MSDDTHDQEQPMERELERLRAMTTAIDFDAGFADRVMQRIARGDAEALAPPSLVLASGLQRTFWRVAPLAVAAALVLSILNISHQSTSNQPLLERALGLPAVSLASAYTLDGSLAWMER
jgi:hypothetical protein